MLTPIFELSQDDNFVKAVIHAPFANVSETEIDFDGKEFLFSSKPYFLRLYLPEEVIENGQESAKYDADTKKFVINMPKKEPCKFFLGLDMITQLLTPPGRAQARRPVEEIADDEENSDEDDDETKWLADQIPPTSSTIALDSKKTHGYGFANQQHGVFASLRDELSEVIDVKTPDDLSITDRRALAIKIESEKFSDDHYLADLYSDDDEIRRLIDQKSFIQSNVPVSFTMEERDRLKNLPKRSITLSEDETTLAMASLIDILFAYAYDYRTTDGEHNVESGWTISKLSSTLSCLVSWTDAKSAIISAIRRSLCYPLIRNWDLGIRVLEDVKEIFKQGKPMVLRCLLDIHRIFANDSDYRYIFNDLYMTEYCIWIQGVEDSVVVDYSNMFDQLAQEVSKSDMDLNLDELELAASFAMVDMEREDNLDSDDEEIGESVISVNQNEEKLESDEVSLDEAQNLMGKLTIN